ncbi:PHP domain-containing protein [uncultured Dysosmobacter sp.]|uniref:PHP domain-containing protein n=1 Tax=uncultured Dysosmobacter sp. TaxID=2591384 RepID=UPI00262FBAE3|nr:PHP domain-containing protein [uncultured Dysosmobacter sp.]
MHVHSTFSPDGISTMEEQCIAALEKGERIICFTDHVDYNVAEKNNGIIKDNSRIS